MLSRLLFSIALLGLLLVESGCGSSSPTTSATSPVSIASSDNPQVVAATPAEKTPEKAAEQTAPATAQAENQPSAPVAQAEITAADLVPVAENTAAKVETPPAEPTTAAAALALVDLEKLPSPTVKQSFESQPMAIYYSTEGSVGGVDELTTKELKKAGWKAAKHLVNSTDQYVDRLLTKDGYYLRHTISTGGSRDEVAVNMIVLGNFDVRQLPQTKDAEPQESTPVMAGHISSLSIPDAVEDLSKRMVDAGWQVVQEFHTPMVEVPHYRSIRFRKNAVRVNLGFVKDPAKPAEKTNIFYHAESVLPIDLPMLDHRQPIKYDTVENRAFIPFQGDRAAVVELLTKHAKEFGWQLLGAEDFAQDKTVVMYLSVGTPIGIAVHRVETGGEYFLSMERVKLPTKKGPETTEDNSNQVAQAANPAIDPAADAAAKKMKSEIDAQFAQAEDAINKAVNDELTKALGSLSGGGAKPDMQALQAQAAKLQAQFGNADEPTADTAPKAPAKKINVLDVPDDEEPISTADQAIKATEARIKSGDREFVLKHALSYARIEDGVPTKIILLSDKPLLAEKLDKMCASGKEFMIYDGFGQNRPEASLELRITANNVMLQLAADGFSLSTNSSDIKSTVRLKGGKLQGRVNLAKPMEFRGQPLTFEAVIADKVRRAE